MLAGNIWMGATALDVGKYKLRLYSGDGGNLDLVYEENLNIGEGSLLADVNI
jgi:hypothetical protein